MQSIIVLILLTGLLAFPATASEQTPERVGFIIAFSGVETDLSIISTTIMPRGTIAITTAAQAIASHGTLTRLGQKWIWQAPAKPGLSTLTFRQNHEQIVLNLFTLTPFQNGKQQSLNGYQIGAYNAKPLKGLAAYQAPTGFIAMDESLAATRIAPHFTLGQFVCKQQPEANPKYLLVRTATLIKLETLLQAARAKGWTAKSFHIMSGFRTPAYNASIGNKTTSSRHLFGGAADIWLDSNGSGQMDDLNHDGKINKDDARALADLAETLAAKGGRNWPAGGIGVYKATPDHGPFIHIDARGYPARW